MAREKIQREAGRIALFSLGLIILFGGQVFAQDGKLPAEYLDLNIWFKLVLTALLAVLIWIWNNTHADVKRHEARLNARDKVEVDVENRLALIEKEIELAKHESKNTLSLVLAQRELMLTRYHDKEETERHRLHVEETLRSICKQVERVSDRMDTLARPHHRFEDDVNHERRVGDKG